MSVQDIWNTLINTGATPIQAAGILGNIESESGFNPEANSMDSNGYRSYGLIQWNAKSYPNASSLVTGNSSQDIISQIRFLAQTGGFRAASGNTAGEAGSNFAANYERCQSCAAGGSQNNTRSQQATSIYQNALSGKWSNIGSGSGNNSTTSVTNASAEANSLFCIWSLNVPSVAGLGGGTTCILSKTEARAIMGAMLLGIGGILVLSGVAVLVAYGFQKTGMLNAVSKIPGTGAVVKTTAKSSTKSKQSTADRLNLKPVNERSRG